MLSYSTGASGSGHRRREGHRGDGAGAGAGARPARRGSDPVRRRDRRRRGPRPSCPDSAGRRPGDRVRLPRPQHRQQHLQGGAALGGRARRRPDPAGPAQAGERPVAGGARCATSSTPSPSPRSRPRSKHRRRPSDGVRAGRQRRLVVAEVQPGRRRDRRGAARPDRWSGSARRRAADAQDRRRVAHRGAAVPDVRGRPGRCRRRVRGLRPLDGRRRGGRGRPPRRARRRPLLRAGADRRRAWSRRSRTWCRWPRCTTPPTSRASRWRRKLFPDLPQVAVFDTAYHQTMPPVAYTYAVPAAWREEHRIRRYGFHGTSHTLRRRRRPRPSSAGRPRTPTSSSCISATARSATAVRGGESVDTSMGLTPLEGLVMGTRSGDLDPAVHAHLHRQLGWSLDEHRPSTQPRVGSQGTVRAQRLPRGDGAAGRW